MKMGYSIYRRDFIKRGMVTAAALSAFSPAVCASRDGETQDAVAKPVKEGVEHVLSAGHDGETQHAVDEILRCSFCSKSQDEVRKLIAGPSVFICDECVDVCQEIIADEVTGEPDHTWPSDTKYGCNLCGVLSPAEQSTIIQDRGVAVCKSCVDAILATLMLEKRDG